MSFQIAIRPNRRAAARYVGKVRRALQKAFADNPDITRKAVADEIGVDKSVITRQLNGHADMSLGRVGEIAYALGYEADFSLKRRQVSAGDNKPLQVAPVKAKVITTGASELYTVKPDRRILA